jgi:hypothetical protein
MLHSKTSIAHVSDSITGIVLNDRASIVIAQVIAIKDDIVVKTEFDQQGIFQLEVELEQEYSVTIFKNNTETKGIDYLPLSFLATVSEEEYTLVLEESALISLVEDIQFVESEELPLATFFEVIDPLSGDLMKSVRLLYYWVQQMTP